MSVFQYARDNRDRLDVRRFVLGMRLYGHRFYVCDRQIEYLTACGGWARRWLHFGGRGAAWLRCMSPGPILRSFE